MARKKTFYDIVTEAVNDMALHGFDSAERVAYWTERLRLAAAGATKSTADMTAMLRRALETIYLRLVDQGGVLRATPGVSRFTIERVKPTLRAELDRRILASASLIRLNKEEAIEKTIRRFQGWATSIPKGGSAEPEKQEAKASIRKSITSLPYVERRVLIDQGHKLGSAICNVVATGNGAIAATWKSNFAQPGYDYREDHRERSGKIFLIRDSWAHAKGLVKSGADGYTDDITQPAEEPFCRCRYVYIFHLRQLPADMITAKGREELERVRAA